MNSMPIIQEILSDRRRFMSLLLLADEQESMVERYLECGRMFVMYSFEGEPIASAIVTEESDCVCELKSLAVASSFQRQGFGRRMMDFLCSLYSNRFDVMTVGTGYSFSTVSFYENSGFHYSHVVPDFFRLNYDHPIWEEGKLLKDMVYLKKQLL